MFGHHATIYMNIVASNMLITSAWILVAVGLIMTPNVTAYNVLVYCIAGAFFSAIGLAIYFIKTRKKSESAKETE